MAEGWRCEAAMADGSSVWIGPSFGLMIPKGADPAAEIHRMEKRLRKRPTEVKPMGDDVAFQLVDPFECDDPAFTLGVEWELFRQQIDKETAEFEKWVHPENRDRLVRLGARRGRQVEVVLETDGWVLLRVHPKTERVCRLISV